MHRLLAFTVGLACATLATDDARADAPVPGVATHALIVGSNTGGPGQAALRYSEDDARRVAAMLLELGGVAADAIDVVVQPTPSLLRDRLDKLTARVAADRSAGRQARVVFYYSGHARSTAIDLGAEQLALGELRQRLFAIPATLTVVVLDACQSGAFSRIKGAQPAADFSFNSRQRLDASGIAVLASSSSSELSQESEQLRSSYFTHHLLVGLRGAGDSNTDGQITIDEAYRYAYHQTLLATAQTAVGGQHVSLEVDLKGHGDVALSFPRAATAAIELPAALEGQALVENKRSRTVIAETYKAKGAPVRLAVAPGEYRVLVRHAGRVARCEVSTGSGTAVVELARCPSEVIVVAANKGPAPQERALHFELAGILGDERADAYVETLEAFGYRTSFGADTSVGLVLSVMQRVDRRLLIGGFAATVGSPEWSQATERQPLRFSWNTTAIGALTRAVQPFEPTWWLPRSEIYAQAGIGLGVATTRFTGADDERTQERFFGWALTMGGGLHIDVYRGVGFSLGYQFDYAPVITNLTGDTHASGGHRLSAAVSYAH